MESLYDLLGVDRDADRAAVLRAYREQVRRHHPDVSDDADASQRFARINFAREVLADPAERARYDRLGHEAYLRRRGVDDGELADAPPAGDEDDGPTSYFRGAGDTPRDRLWRGAASAPAGAPRVNAMRGSSQRLTRSNLSSPVGDAAAVVAFATGGAASYGVALSYRAGVGDAGPTDPAVVLLALWSAVAVAAAAVAGHGEVPSTGRYRLPLAALVVGWALLALPFVPSVAGAAPAALGGLLALRRATGAADVASVGRLLLAGAAWFAGTAPAAFALFARSGPVGRTGRAVQWATAVGVDVAGSPALRVAVDDPLLLAVAAPAAAAFAFLAGRRLVTASGRRLAAASR